MAAKKIFRYSCNLSCMIHLLPHECQGFSLLLRLSHLQQKEMHSATNMTPNEASKKNNELKAKVNVAMKARKDRIYPELSVGDKVKIMRKKAITEKERTSHFLKGEYTVESISKSLGQTYLKIKRQSQKITEA